MRVLVVAPLYHTDRGGLGRQAVLLTEHLASLGVRATVVTRTLSGLPAREPPPGVELHRIRAGRPRVHNYEAKSARNLVTSLRFSGGLVRALLALRRTYDLVHFHGASLPLLVAQPWARLLGKPVLAKVAAVGQGVEAGDLAGRYGPLGDLLARRLRAVDVYVATTGEIEAALAAEGHRWIERIPNFVDTERFRPPGPGRRARLRAELGFANRPVVLFSGRLTPRKEVDTLLRAFARVPARQGAAPLLVILGDGPLRARLEGLARARGLTNRVRFVGFRPRPWRWLAAADVFVLPSSVEGLPNALLEAMACGLPCVATALGGAREVLGERGLLVPVGDEAALVASLSELTADPARREALGRAAAERIARDFSLRAVAPRYLDLYRRLLARSSSTP